MSDARSSSRVLERSLRRPALLVLAVAGVVAFPILLSGEVSAQQSRDLLRAQERETVRTAAIAAAAAVKSRVSALRTELVAAADDPALKQAVQTRDRFETGNALSRVGRYMNLSVAPGGEAPDIRLLAATDATGVVITEIADLARGDEITIGRDLSSASPFSELREGARLTAVSTSDVRIGTFGPIPVGQVSRDPRGGPALGATQPIAQARSGVLIGAPIPHALDPFAGALLAEIHLGRLAGVLKLGLGEVHDLYLLDRSFSLLAHVGDGPGSAGDDLRAVASAARTARAGNEPFVTVVEDTAIGSAIGRGLGLARAR